MEQSRLFEAAKEQQTLPTPPERGAGKPRLWVAVRDQIVMRTLALDQMLPQDDEARLVWDFVSPSRNFGAASGGSPAARGRLEGGIDGGPGRREATAESATCR
jgi:hypothetical protein